MIRNLSDSQLATRLELAERMTREATDIKDMKLWNGIVQQIIDEQTIREMQPQPSTERR